MFLLDRIKAYRKARAERRSNARAVRFCEKACRILDEQAAQEAQRRDLLESKMRSGKVVLLHS